MKEWQTWAKDSITLEATFKGQKEGEKKSNRNKTNWLCAALCLNGTCDGKVSFTLQATQSISTQKYINFLLKAEQTRKTQPVCGWLTSCLAQKTWQRLRVFLSLAIKQSLQNLEFCFSVSYNIINNSIQYLSPAEASWIQTNFK